MRAVAGAHGGCSGEAADRENRQYSRLCAGSSRAKSRNRATSPSCPALCRASTSYFERLGQRQTWMAGTSPAMTPRVDSRSSEHAVTRLIMLGRIGRARRPGIEYVSFRIWLCANPTSAKTQRMVFLRSIKNRSRIRIIATKVAIGKIIHSMGAPHHRVFIQPRAIAVMRYRPVPNVWSANYLKETSTG
jgi:hypothetical protein